MKYFLTILVFFCVASHCLAQDAPQVQGNSVTECIVYFVDNIKKAEKSDDDKIRDGIEIGRFLPHLGGEGTLTLKRFRVGKLKLFVFASVFYEDDLSVGDSLTDAMTMSLGITRSSSKIPKSYIATSDMQIEYRKDFNAANLDVSVNQGAKYSSVRLRCERNN